jgi:hypothetical protein
MSWLSASRTKHGRGVTQMAVQTPSGSAALVCPHCQSRGTVTKKDVKVKRGISGGKATGAILTGGLSLFATGLSRKDSAIEMHCSTCNMTWRV